MHQKIFQLKPIIVVYTYSVVKMENVIKNLKKKGIKINNNDDNNDNK